MKWLDTIRAYRKIDPAAKSNLEVMLLYPGVWAVFLYRIAHLLYGIKFYFLARLISQIARFITGIEIHPGAQIGERFVIDHGTGSVIGETSIIGDDVMLYHGVTLGSTVLLDKKRHPTVGNNVTIGTGATILGNINIGNNVTIGAQSMVLADVADNLVVVGLHKKVKNEKSIWYKIHNTISSS